MEKLIAVICCCSFLFASAQNKSNDRKLWLDYLDKIARPVIMNLAHDRLKEKMTVELSKMVDNKESRTQASYLEAFGRTISGISAWLDLEGGSEAEIKLRDQYRQWTLKAIANAVNPFSKDYLKWTGGQPLVDASFFAFGLVRSSWLWNHLDTAVKLQVVTALKQSRSTIPAYSNWTLFSAMIEAFFCKYGYEYDPVRIEYAVREFSQHWYIGDGTFSDGMQYHDDYYNSYVIQPYLATIVSIANAKAKTYSWFSDRLDKITKRYAEIQERAINMDGTFSVTGRSITYRTGAFHHLADISLRKQLPASLPPAQVRSALTAVIKKVFDAPNTFTKDGWLNLGLYGYQPDLADSYINTGSEYLCTAVFLPLGLPETDEFWSSPSMPWTSVKVWSGQNTVPADHALDIRQ
ncbi:MAG TPA: DUF2264 domain-containing protein [Flavisolibacter sp.]|jgi:hypothetical protein|nr:DUF2264 domain-containing protein [Flavisolibacter sp.]